MSLFSRLAALLFPPRCIFCRRVTDGEDICPACRDTLPRCVAVKCRGEFYSGCCAPLYYRGSVRSALLRYKFRGRTGYARELGRLVAQCVREELAGEFDLITWAPVSRKRLRERGFDQAKLLAQRTGEALGAEPVETLRKIRETPRNSTIKGRAERAANVLGVYEAVDPALVRGRRVLLIDDIVTTGATLSECARTLLMAGAEDVVCAAAAFAGKNS